MRQLLISLTTLFHGDMRHKQLRYVLTANISDQQRTPYQAKSEVEVRGSTWYPKIAGTYETELFSGSGWKPAKNLEITPQGHVLYGGARADGVSLDTDTMAFEFCAPLQDVSVGHKITFYTTMIS